MILQRKKVKEKTSHLTILQVSALRYRSLFRTVISSPTCQFQGYSCCPFGIVPPHENLEVICIEGEQREIQHEVTCV